MKPEANQPSANGPKRPWLTLNDRRKKMKMIAVFAVVAALGGCAEAPVNSAGTLAASAHAIPSGAAFDVAFEGEFMRDPGFKSVYPLRVADFLDFRWSPSPRHADYAHVTRINDTLNIDLIAAPTEVVGSMSLTLSEVSEEGRMVLRHEERKTSGDEWGSRYYVEQKDFYLSDDGKLVLHIHSKGISRTLLVVPLPCHHDLLMMFPRRPIKIITAQRASRVAD